MLILFYVLALFCAAMVRAQIQDQKEFKSTLGRNAQNSAMVITFLTMAGLLSFGCAIYLTFAALK